MERVRVLVVDDNEATLTLLTALLQREFGIDIAHDGLEAIEKLRTNRYAAVLLDVRMPGADGFTVLDHVKQSAPETLRNVIILTAALHRRDLERLDDYSVCTLIAKPFEVETLLAAVRRCADSEGGIALTGMLSGGMLMLLADLLRTRLM